MRDLIITLMIFGAIPFAIRHTWIAVLLWTWISVMNPHRLTWDYAFDMPFAAIAAAAALISLVLTRDKLSFPWGPPVVALILFLGWVCLTTLFAIYPQESFDYLKLVLKIQLMSWIALAALHERRHIQWFVWINALSIGFFSVKGGLFTILTGGGSRVWGPPGGFIEGNNEIGLATVMTIPLLYYLYLTTAHKWMRLGLIGVMVLSGFAALGTQSRGAFVAIAAMLVVLWWRAPKKLWSGIALSLVVMTAAGFMPQSYVDRILTIRTYEQDGSALGRLNAWETAINVANDRPLGAGFAMYTPAVHASYSPDKEGPPRAAHSIYFQVLGEHGWVGLMLFLAIWALAWRQAAWIRRKARGDPQVLWAFHLAGMCQVALVGYCVGGAFLSLAYFDLPYNLLICIVVTRRWLAMHLADQKTIAANRGSGTMTQRPLTAEGQGS